MPVKQRNDRPLLVLGASTGLASACRDLRIRAVRAVGPWEKDYVLRAEPADADDVFVEDPARADLVVAALERAGLACLDFAGVCVTSDAYVGAASLLRPVLCQRSNDVRCRLSHKDKFLQKRAVTAAGVEVTPHALIEDIWEPQASADWTSFPAVLKPVAQEGSVGVHVVRDRDELDQAMASARARSIGRTYLLERFVGGAELHLDGVVSAGTLVFLSIGRYDVTCLAAACGQLLSARLADPARDRGLYARGRQLVLAVLPTLAIDDGVFHLEAFERADGTLLFSECAARLGGAAVPHATLAKFGVDLWRAYVETELGLPVHSAEDSRPDAVGWMVLPVPSGRLTAVPDPDRLRALPGVIHGDIRRPLGAEILAAKVSSTYGLGTAVIAARDEDALADRIRAVAQWCLDHTATAAPSADKPPPAFLLWRRPAMAAGDEGERRQSSVIMPGRVIREC